MDRIRALIQLVSITTLVAACPGMSGAAETSSGAADRLVSLVKPHEREAQAIRFMVTVAPLGFPEGLADCMVKKAVPVYKTYFAALYAQHLSESDLQQAGNFFQSEDGQAAINIQLHHEQGILNAAAKGEQVGNEKPEYPLRVRKALEEFGSTPAGKLIVGDGLAAVQSFKSEVTDIRNSAMAKCLADPALRGGKTESPQ
jgi:Uncharacterized protein conserved in bacteria (DUF2059)